MGVFIEQRLIASVHKVQAVVDVGVDAPAIYAKGLYAPEGVLDEEFRQIWIILVQVGHLVGEPAVAAEFLIDVAGVRVQQRLIPVVSLGVFWPLMQPGLFRKVLYKNMIKADVVVDGVL